MSRKETVTKVIDGDTFKTSSRKNPVRLANVDAPEKGQPGAKKAKKALEAMIKGEQVTIETTARDRYGRSVAKVKKGRQSVNAAMRRVTNRKATDKRTVSRAAYNKVGSLRPSYTIHVAPRASAREITQTLGISKKTLSAARRDIHTIKRTSSRAKSKP